MTKEAQTEQLIEAVKRHPGSPAYALLAEHYLQEHQLDEAVRICQEGFAANPAHERGALAYLAVLRALRDHRRAGEVFGRAVAYVPRSSKLRVSWAMILAEAGREQEARRIAREAADLDPLNREARALVATLAGVSSSTGTTREYPLVSEEGATAPTDAELPDGEEADLSAQAKAQRATVRPRVRPIGQHMTPHQLFDLTPGPSMLDPHRHGAAGSPFDITPLPLITPQPDGVAVDVVATEELVEDPTTEQPSPPLTHVPEVAPPPEQAPAAAAAPLPTQAPPAAFSRSRALEGTRPARFASARKPVPRQPLLRRWWFWTSVLAVAAAAGAGAFGYQRWAEDRAIRTRVVQALDLTKLDRLRDYRQARQQLEALRGEHPADARVLSALALLSAQLSDLLGDEALRKEASQLGEAALRAPNGQTLATPALALLYLTQGKAREAEAVVGALDRREWGWQTYLAWHRAALRDAQAAQAGARLEAALSAFPSAVALWHDAAVFYRRRGETDRCRDALVQGTKLSPGHLGLRIQAALFALAQQRQLSPDQLSSLTRNSDEGPRYRADLALLQAEAAANAGHQRDALVALRQAHQLSPTRSEYAIRLAIQLVAPDGDVGEALPLFEQHLPSVVAISPGLLLWHARALLLMARPHEARAVLDRLPRGASLDQQTQRSAAALDARLLHLTDRLEELRQSCERAARDAALPLQLSCLEACLERSWTACANGITARLKDPEAHKYVLGLRALATGDTAAAIARLKQVRADGLPDSVLPQLALTLALVAQGEPQQAVTLLRRVVAHDARSVRSRIALALALVASGQDSEAQALLEEILAARPTQSSVLGQTGQAFLDLGLPAKAQQLIQHGLRFNPGQSAALKLLAGRIALANNQPQEARRLFDEVLKVTPSSPEALVELGRIEAATGHSREAQSHFARALKQRPNDPDLLLLLCRVHLQAHDYKTALGYGTRAIGLLSKSHQTQRLQESLIDLGRRFRDGDRWALARAEELLFEATKSPTAPANAFYEFGLVYIKQHDVNRAAWCFRQALQRDGEFAEAYLKLGYVLSRKRSARKDARSALLHYLKLRPKGKESEYARSLLQRLR